MIFLYGSYGWIWGVILAVAGLVVWRRRRHGLVRWIHPNVWAVVVHGFNHQVARRKQVLVWAAVGLLGIAVLRPQFGTTYQSVTGSRQSVLVAVDASQSMDATDGAPSRMALVKQDFTTLLNQLSGDRVGLIGFSGVAAIQCPFTIDYPALKLLMGDLNTQAIPVPGTNLAAPIEKATAVYRDTPGRKTLVIYSDGESFEGDFRVAAQSAKAAGIVIHTVGVGTIKGASIPIAGTDSSGGGLKTSRQSEVVVSKLNENALKTVAELTGGRYIRLTPNQAAAPQLGVLLGKSGVADYRAYLTPVRQDRYVVLAVLALIALAIDWWVSAYRRPKQGGATDGQ